jgi:hypothetical protein
MHLDAVASKQQFFKVLSAIENFASYTPALVDESE